MYALVLPGLFLARGRHRDLVALGVPLLLAVVCATAGALLLRAARAPRDSVLARWVCAALSLGLLALGALNLGRATDWLGLATAGLFAALGAVGAAGASVVLLSGERQPER